VALYLAISKTCGNAQDGARRARQALPCAPRACTWPANRDASTYFPDMVDMATMNKPATKNMVAPSIAPMRDGLRSSPKIPPMTMKTPQTFAALMIRLGGGGSRAVIPNHTEVRLIFNGWGERRATAGRSARVMSDPQRSRKRAEMHNYAAEELVFRIRVGQQFNR
jgi:hypothetical protein